MTSNVTRPVASAHAYGRGDLEESRKRRRIQSLRQVFQKVASMIAGRHVPIHVEWNFPQMHPAPGWTDGSSIFLSGPYLDKAIDRAKKPEQFNGLLLAMKGLIYHETCHINYTPGVNDAGSVTKWARDMANGGHANNRLYWWAFNALEDQRIETMFTTIYAPATKFFTATVMEWLVDKRPDNRALPLLHGRKYLPAKLRRQAWDAFIAHHTNTVGETRARVLATEIEKVIDEYVTLNLFERDDTRRAINCVRRMEALLSQIIDPVNDDQPTNDGGDGAAATSVGVIQRSAGSKKQKAEVSKEAVETVKDAMAAGDFDKDEDEEDEERSQPSKGSGGDASDEDESDEESGDGDPSDDGDTSSSDPQASDGEDDGGKGDSDDAGDESAGVGEQEGPSNPDTPGTGASTGGQDNGMGEPQDLDQMARDLLEAILESPEMQDDIRGLAETIERVMDGESGFGAKDLTPQEAAPAMAATVTVRTAVKHLRRLTLDLEPERQTHQTAGRLSTRRAMASRGLTVDVFDRWDEGVEDEGGVEAVILLDLSGSMHGMIARASLTMWTIKRCFDDIGARCTVLGFSDSWYTLYSPEEKASRSLVKNFGTIGGTTAGPALRQAYHILSNSREPNRILLTITDGGFGDMHDANEVAEAVSALPGTTTWLVGIGGAMVKADDRMTWRGHQHGTPLTKIEDVAVLAKSLVENVMRSAATERNRRA